ncbi:MAG TPA: hypothetical protein VH475_23095 [Tepidisphaeraceae bacterium]|jgi:hypothetical protein
MRCIAVAIFAGWLLAAGGSAAAEDLARSQVQAATKDAINGLLDEVSRTPLSRSLSVGEFLRRTRSTDELVKTLERAQQMGGPRWIDDQTCQVELQISGPVVAQALKRAAAANPKESPLSPRELDRATHDWDARAFTATGTATSRLPVARPRRAPRMGLQKDPWLDVPEAVRDQAVAAAKADAARRSLASVRPIALTHQSTVGDVLAVKDVGDSMQQWFVSQPAARADFTDDLEARVELAAGPDDTFTAFRGFAQKQKEVALPADDQGWNQVKGDFERQMVTPVGRAVAGGGRGERGGPGIGNDIIGHPKPFGLVGSRPPAWVDRRIDATGRGTSNRSKLMAARAAESEAESKLRNQIESLPLTDKQTIGQAAKDDPRVDQAIGRALNRSRISKADYLDNGAADVSVYLDLDVVWEELHNLE